MSATTATTSFSLVFFFFLLHLSSNGPHLAICSPTFSPGRRILHQPFFPVSSLPPALPPSLSPPSPLTPKYPFSGPTPDDQTPFFPSDPPSPPPPPSPPSSTPFASFPANISSLIFPHSSPSSSSAKPTSRKFFAVTVGLSLIAAVVAAVALFFFLRSRRKPHEKPSTPANTPPPPPPQLSKPSSNSSEFLYLGTLVNATAIDGGGARGGTRRSGAVRKLQSPELHPLPPLTGRQQPPLMEEEGQEEFYSPRGSASGRESGSGSRRVFEAVVRAQADHLMNNNGGSSDESSSSSTTSSGSPARSASISISPPVSISPKNRSNPKSSPEFIELQVQPPLPDMAFSPPYSRSPSSERGMETIKEEEDDEAEESPLLSNSSSSSRMTTSPVESPRLSPLTRIIRKEEREWGILGRTSPPLSNASTPSRKSPSLKRPAFLGGKRRDSTSSQSTSMSNSPLSSHSDPPSPISSTASSSRKSRSYPASPLSNASSAENSPSSSARISSSAPPPATRRSKSPPPPPPPPPPVAEPVAVPMPPGSVGHSRSVGRVGEGATLRPRLKPLRWDKVRASPHREMIWDHQLKSGSFKLNEEMIERLFFVNTPNPNQKDLRRKPVQPSPMQETRVLDPKKAQNIAILLRALNLTIEEVCEALLEGNADNLGPELLESLLKMAPTEEEECKLKEYEDDSPVKLGQAEKFLKAVIDIPFAFKRMEAMLYIANFESEVEYLKKSFETLEAACDELRNNRMFLKLLEAVLKTGNRMNIGTNHGDAHAFKLDTLIKLVDIKGADGKTTLLHFVVQEIIRTEGQRLSIANNQISNDEAKCRKLGLQVVLNLSSDLTNVKKAAAMDSDALSNDVAKLTLGLRNIDEVVRLNEQTHLPEPSRRFSESMNRFMKMTEEEIIRVQAQESVALSLVKEITEYFHGDSAKEEAHPFRIFMVVRDFLTILDRVCKEVGMINEQMTVTSTNRSPVPVNPKLPIPVNRLFSQVLPGFPETRQSSFSEDDGSP